MTVNVNGDNEWKRNEKKSKVKVNDRKHFTNLFHLFLLFCFLQTKFNKNPCVTAERTN